MDHFQLPETICSWFQSLIVFEWRINTYNCTNITVLKSCVCFWCFHNIFQFSYYFSIIILYFWKGSLSIAMWHKSQMNGNDYLFRFQAAFVKMFHSLSWFQAASITETPNNSSWSIHFIVFHPRFKKKAKLSLFSSSYYYERQWQLFIIWLQPFFPYLPLSVLEDIPAFPAGHSTSQSHWDGAYSQWYL